MSGCWTSHKIRGKGCCFCATLREKGLSCLCAILGKENCLAFGQFWAKRLFCSFAILGERFLFCEEGLVRGGRGRGRGREGVVVGCCCVFWIVLFVCVVLCCVVVLSCLFCGLQLQCGNHHHGSRE